MQKRCINKQMSFMKKKLAIVIPAYKATFFQETLESIANQSCMDFTLYIGNDASPNNLFDIVSLYEDKIDIVYKYFENNLGGKDLISHWNRCIDMSIDEEWIWLFSDDDLIESTCVEVFYKYLESDSNSQLLHFNADIIDGKGNDFAKANRFPLNMTSADFFKKRMNKQIFSFAIEYVFTRKLFFEEKGFQAFDLAWCSDDATWIKFGNKTGISTMDTDFLVHWRYSGENISSLNVEESILYRKLNSKVEYLNWAKYFFKKNMQNIHVNPITKVKWILSDLNEVFYLNIATRVRIAYKYARFTGNIINGLLGVSYVFYHKIRYFKHKK